MDFCRCRLAPTVANKGGHNTPGHIVRFSQYHCRETTKTHRKVRVRTRRMRSYDEDCFHEVCHHVDRRSCPPAAMKCAPALLLGVALTTSAPLVDHGVVGGIVGTAPVFAADDTSKGMASVSDSKLSYGAASTGDKGWSLACISILTCDTYESRVTDEASSVRQQWY